MIQGSEEWLQARCGSIGATAVTDAMMKVGTAGRRNLVSRLICERLTGTPKETFQSWQMAQGTAREPFARKIYEFNNDVKVEEVALVKHPTIIGSHASPDGLILSDGGLEIKCPEPSAHLFDHVMAEELPSKYIVQCQWAMACTGRKWWDFVSYCPDLPAHLMYHERRIMRDQAMIDDLEKAVSIIIDEVDTTIKKLEEKCQ